MKISNFLSSWNGIINVWDVVFGTVWRDYSVYTGTLNGNSNQAILDSGLGANIGFLAGGIGIAAILSILQDQIKERNAYLQHHSKDYFVAKMLQLDQYLSELRQNELKLHSAACESSSTAYIRITDKENLARALSFYGEQNCWFTRWANKLTENKEQLNSLKALKDTLMNSALEEFGLNNLPKPIEEPEQNQSNDTNKAISFGARLLNFLEMVGDAANYYMMNYWFVWFTAWVITGLTGATTLLMAGLTFGLPLIPVAIYAISKFVNKADSAKEDLAFYRESRRKFITQFFNGLTDIVSLRARELEVNKINGKIVEIQEQLDKTQLDSHSFAKASIDSINNSSTRKYLVSFIGGVFSGFICAEFLAWPLTAFLCTLGITAAAGPVAVAAIAVASLVFAIYYGIKKTHEQSQAQRQLQEKIEKGENKAKIKNLETLEKKNASLEQMLEDLYEDAKKFPSGDADKIKPINALKSISSQDRFFRRMDMSPSTPRTALKKFLHRAFTGLGSTGTGILMIRLLFSAGCVFTLSNPAAFLIMASVTGLVWGAYKVWSHCKDRQDKRDEALLNNIDLRIQAEEEKKNFLINQLAVNHLTWDKIKTKKLEHQFNDNRISAAC